MRTRASARAIKWCEKVYQGFKVGMCVCNRVLAKARKGEAQGDFRVTAATIIKNNPQLGPLLGEKTPGQALQDRRQ